MSKRRLNKFDVAEKCGGYLNLNLQNSNINASSLISMTMAAGSQLQQVGQIKCLSRGL